MQHALQFAGSRRRLAEVANFLVENHAADCVVLAGSKKRQARRKKLAIAQFAHWRSAEAHRRTGVQQNHQVRVGITEETLDVSPFGAREYVPVDKARIVTLVVGTVLSELLAEAECR